jgi:hypothetical protein
MQTREEDGGGDRKAHEDNGQREYVDDGEGDYTRRIDGM